jgi:hypothetical protein
MSPSLTTGRTAWFDRIGISASLVCALHCIALTSAVAIWPALWLRQRLFGIEVRWLLLTELALAALSVLAAASALVAGYSRHRSLLPGLLMVPGMVALGIGVFSQLHRVPGWGTAIVVFGGALLIGGHLMNLRAQQRT